MFLVKFTISAMRCSADSSFQKLCITGDTAAKNPMMAAAPSLGFVPRMMLDPPTTSANPVSATVASGLGTCLVPAYCASSLRLMK
jgi:hypothetical protein